MQPTRTPSWTAYVSYSNIPQWREWGWEVYDAIREGCIHDEFGATLYWDKDGIPPNAKDG